MDDVETMDRVRTIGVALVLTVFGLGAGVALSLAGVVILGAVGVELTNSVLIVISLVMTQGVAFGGVALAYLRYRDLDADFVPAGVPSLREAMWIVGGYVLAFVLVYAAALLATLQFGEVETQNQVAQAAMESPEVLLILIPASFVLIGPGEELLFRGIVQGTLREVFSAGPAIVIASGIFAAIHFVALTGAATARLIAVAILFFPALVFGTAYERTDNLVVPSLIHGAYNATLFGLLYVAIEYGPELRESAQTVLSFL